MFELSIEWIARCPNSPSPTTFHTKHFFIDMLRQGSIRPFQRLATWKSIGPANVLARIAPSSILPGNGMQQIVRNFSFMTLTRSKNLVTQVTNSMKPVVPFNQPIRLISTRRRRRTKMNNHKLKKRRKLLRMNTKASRGRV